MEERLSVQLIARRDGGTATSAFVKRLHQSGIRPKLRLERLHLTDTLARVVRACTKRWQDQLQPNESFQLYLNDEEITDYSTTLDTQFRQAGRPRVQNQSLLTLRYAMHDNCHAPPCGEAEQDRFGEQW